MDNSVVKKIVITCWLCIFYILPQKQTLAYIIGWLHNDKYVTSKKGGGQTKLDINRSAQYDNILEAILNVYSSEGVFPRYPLNVSSVSCSVTQFNGAPIPRGVCFEEIVKKVGTPTRIYLCTKVRLLTTVTFLKAIFPTIPVLGTVVLTSSQSLV